jgi:hypothetical protein
MERLIAAIYPCGTASRQDAFDSQMKGHRTLQRRVRLQCLRKNIGYSRASVYLATRMRRGRVRINDASNRYINGMHRMKGIELGTVQSNLLTFANPDRHLPLH